MSRIKDWFFQESSPYQLALLRIGLAAISFLILVRFQSESILHFSDAGWFPREGQSWFYPQPSHWSPLFWGGDPAYVQFFFLIAILASVFMLFGFCTPIAAPLTWIAILSIRARNLTVTDGTEFVLQFALMYLSFTDSGQVWSVDQSSGLRQKIWRRASAFLTRSSWPLRMIQIHLLIIYFVAGASKILGAQFWDGSFVSIALMNRNYARWDLGFLQGSYLSIFISKVMTHLIVLWELSFPFLVLHKRFVKLAIISGVVFHLGILFFLKLSYFPLVMIVCFLCFFPRTWFKAQ